MSNQLLTLLRRRREELAGIAPSRSNWSRITEWHARTRPLISQHFSSELDAFDRLLVVRWVAFPRFISLSNNRVDNSQTDAAENAGNERVVHGAHAKLLAHVDALIELYHVDDAQNQTLMNPIQSSWRLTS